MFFIFCSCLEPQITAEKVLQKSIQAHGGENLANKIKSIHYNKSTKLFDANGQLESHVSQKIVHQWSPFLTKINWENEEKSYVAQKKSDEVSLYINGQLIKDTLKINQTKSSLDAALYVFWQPFKLVDPTAKKVYLGKQKILDSIDVLALKVYYSEDPKADVWHYYLNPNNYKIRAVKVDHNERTSMILNEHYETETGLSLNKTRKSYFLDSLGQIKYLRAAYKYEITLVEYYKK